MTSNVDDTIYRQELMEYYKNPSNKGVVTDATIVKHGKNPMCGDELNISLKIEDNRIAQFMFEGDSCAVSTISASLLTDELTGKTLEEAARYSKEDLLELIGIPLTTSRVKCATLVLDTLQEALNEYKKG